MSPDRRLDATGTLCPLPILMTAREMAKLRPGECLEVIGDDPGILEDMPAWCQATGHRLLEMDQRGAIVRCLVERAEKGEERPAAGPLDSGPNHC